MLVQRRLHGVDDKFLITALLKKMINRGKKILTQTLTILLIVAIVLPVAFFSYFSYPKKSDAFIQCFLGGLMGNVKSKVAGIAGSIMAVPVVDQKNAAINEETQSNTGQLSTKECVLDFVVAVLGQTLIDQFTDSVVDWINNGFEGSPAFVSDPEEFFLDVGDQVAGEIIMEVAPELCSRFNLDILLQLGISYGGRYKDRIRCRLSDVIDGINSFSNGNFFSGGWNNWISVSQHSSNNRYGSFLDTEAELRLRVAGKTQQKRDLLSQGRGFLSKTQCVEWDNSEPKKCIKEKVVTPGSVIEVQVNEALPSGLRKLELADEINEIVGALVAQGMKQAFSSSGLAPAANQRRTGPSFQERYRLALTASTVTPPVGFPCARINDFVLGTNNAVMEKSVDSQGNRILIATSWTLAQLEQARNGCSNQYMNQSVGSAINQAGYNDPNNFPNPNSVDQNTISVAPRQNVTTQGTARKNDEDATTSSYGEATLELFRHYRASFGVDGIKAHIPGNYIGSVYTLGSPPWWEVSLTQSYPLEKIVIYPSTVLTGFTTPNTDFFRSLDDISIIIYGENGSSVTMPVPGNGQTSNPIEIKMCGAGETPENNSCFPKGATVSKVRMEGPGNCARPRYSCTIAFDELEIYARPYPRVVSAQSGSIEVGDLFNPISGMRVIDADGLPINQGFLLGGEGIFVTEVSDENKNTVPLNADGTVTFLRPGTYSIRYRISDSYGATMVYERNVTVFDDQTFNAG